MPYILVFAFFMICMIAERINKRAHGNVLEPARNANAELQRTTTGKLVFGEHWQAWAEAISQEAAEPWEEQAA